MMVRLHKIQASPCPQSLHKLNLMAKIIEFVAEFQKSGKSQGILLSEIHFQPS